MRLLAILSLWTSPLWAEDAPSGDDFADTLFWTFEIPDDLQEDELYITDWHFSNAPKSWTVEPSGLEFGSLEAGQEVTVHLWHKAFLELPASELPSSMKYCLRYRTEEGEEKIEYGQLRIPPGYHDLYSHMASGPVTDSGWILMMINPEKPRNQNACFLHFAYEKKPSNEAK